MNGTVSEWIEKAEADYAMAGHDLASSPRPNFDGICFHAQQCVEKLMKALLIHLALDPPRTHNLMLLDELLRPVCAAWSCPVDDLRFLTHAAGALRYPGAVAEREDAEHAMNLCTRLREALLTLLRAADKANSELQ